MSAVFTILAVSVYFCLCNNFFCIFVFDCAYAFCIWCILWHVSGGNIGWVCKGCQIKVFKSLLHFLTHGISMRGTFILKQLWRTTCIANTAIVQWSKHLWKYVWLKIVKISKCTIKRPHCSIWLKFASIGLLWMSQEATSTFGKCNQWVLEQHPLTFILPRKSNSKLPLFGEHRPFRRWLISILFRCIIFEVIWPKSSSLLFKQVKF